MSYSIPRKPVETKANVNQIGHFKELVAGAGSKVFKVNSAGVFAGATNYAAAPFRLNYNGQLVADDTIITGTITATGGSITGDLSVTGKLIFKSGTTERGRIYSTSGGIYITIDGKGVKIDTNGNVSIPNADLNVYNDITSEHGTITSLGDITSIDGGVVAPNGIVSTNGSAWFKYNIEANGGYITALNDITTRNGSFIAKGSGGGTGGRVQVTNNINTSGGSISASSSENGWISAQRYFICHGRDGISKDSEQTLRGYISGIKWDGDLYVRWTELKVSGGIITGYGSESSWDRVN